MWLSALGTWAQARLAFTVNIGGLRLFILTHCRLNLLRLLFYPELSLDFPLMGLLNLVIQGLAP